MIYIVIALCALVTAFFACRYYTTKILLVEHDIDKAIARKFESSGKAIELAKLREKRSDAKPFARPSGKRNGFSGAAGNGISRRLIQDENDQDPKVSRDTGRIPACLAAA
ncbi:hypothetical protein NT1RE_23720 (plasmid) [Agrobacterium fabrum]|uniref:Uncharacterized protein n=2 Tax=Agrobacterium tumefaciens complex TaxID=1183400 RepID=Q7D3S5_AGRFC|nr:hypothetical protein [Agrobacterium fabrum]KJX90254.1 hypothetical protein SY94_5142 [Agrobacterium tumefaciens]AAD44004.1 AtsD [Agrobacterium fabrum str. C58]AAK90530.1 conserved hypothetical protein [Agrobacterium fabrum str. C58]MCX2875366.1 hypothetical protein [Agrobacterium fabrum]QRM62656.1 hypothetical protein F3P66_25055 [Agrobacterium fabrum]